MPGEALGEFLRSRRERLTPAAVGLPARPRSRTPGLRREDVAELAGIGVDWYVRLEQGRAVRPSPAVLDGLARALRLDDAERGHLRALARNPVRAPFRRERVPAAVRRLVGSLGQPAYVTGRRWDLLVWNAAAAEVFADFAALPEADRNLLVYLLLDPEARRRLGSGWAAQAQFVVAQFRAAHDLWAPDPAFTELSARLSRDCPEFDGWWRRHPVSRRSGAGRKVVHHPTRGELRFEYATFQANEDPALRLTVYTPVD